MHKEQICDHECLTTPDFRAEICGPLEVPPYRQTDLMPHGVPASQRTSAICHRKNNSTLKACLIFIEIRLEAQIVVFFNIWLHMCHSILKCK